MCNFLKICRFITIICKNDNKTLELLKHDNNGKMLVMQYFFNALVIFPIFYKRVHGKNLIKTYVLH